MRKLKIISKLLISFFLAFIFLFSWSLIEIHMPKSLIPSQTIVYDVKKGIGDEEISQELENQGIIKSSLFFRAYVFLTGQDDRLQAGRYVLSASMPISRIVDKFVAGDIIKNRITILEGWNMEQIGSHFEDRGLYSKEDFLKSAEKDWSQSFEILKDKPKNLSLEGYIFPDTYEISGNENPEDLLEGILTNFQKKMTPELRIEIAKQNKSVFQIVIMASIIEKEVKKIEDKKLISGILWKRLKAGMPLQVDATINYITGKNDAGVAIKDTKIDSPYNTYKYKGLPLGPISNPGMDSILAAIYPKESPYWYYLSANGTGKTIFSTTFTEHQLAMARYL